MCHKESIYGLGSQTPAKCEITYLYEGEITFLLSASGCFTCPTRRDHSHCATKNQSRGWDHIPTAKCKITYLFEGEITFLLSVSGGITCPTRPDHSPSVTNNQSMGWDHILQLNVRSPTFTKVRSLSFCSYLVGTCPTRRDHSHSVTNNQPMGWDHISQAKCKITYIYEGEITFLLSVSGGITCPTRRDHSHSVTNNQSKG